MMKAGIEACYLRNIGQSFEDCLDGCQIVWLVQRGKWDELIEFGKNLAVTIVG